MRISFRSLSARIYWIVRSRKGKRKRKSLFFFFSTKNKNVSIICACVCVWLCVCVCVLCVISLLLIFFFFFIRSSVQLSMSTQIFGNSIFGYSSRAKSFIQCFNDLFQCYVKRRWVPIAKRYSGENRFVYTVYCGNYLESRQAHHPFFESL